MELPFCAHAQFDTHVPVSGISLKWHDCPDGHAGTFPQTHEPPSARSAHDVAL